MGPDQATAMTRCAAHAVSSATHTPPARLDRIAASMKATPATPSSIVGNMTPSQRRAGAARLDRHRDFRIDGREGLEIAFRMAGRNARDARAGRAHL